MGQTFIFLGILIFSAHVFAAIFSRKKIPDVLLLMLIGIVIGPLFNWISPEDFGVVGSVFASLTLVFILFESGTDTSIQNLRDSWKNLLKVAIPSFFLSVVLVGILGVAFGLELKAALLLGSILGGTSSAVVIPLVKQMPMSEENRTVLVLESAITDVLCIVFALAFIESYKYASVDVGGIVGKVFSSFIMALMIGVAGGVLWSSVLDRIRKIQNSMFLTPAFVFVLYGMAESMGYSGAIAALAFGIVMGNTEYFEFSFMKKFQKSNTMMKLDSHEKSFFSEIVFILKTFFFVYIGISIPFNDMIALVYGLIITLVLFIMRLLLTKFSISDKASNFDKTIISMMIPKGLAAAVLATLPEQAGIPGGESIKYITYSVVFISILLNSILILLYDRPAIKNFYIFFLGKDGDYNKNDSSNDRTTSKLKKIFDVFTDPKEGDSINANDTQLAVEKMDGKKSEVELNCSVHSIRNVEIDDIDYRPIKNDNNTNKDSDTL
ncbi:MAG: sodium:proton antiporter [Bacteroidales bacterium]|jgi:NhaP-type Na+/H+ or K+/H+ antiporter|nr:sodium:proton antiporter [Bacteroidales bacterium]